MARKTADYILYTGICRANLQPTCAYFTRDDAIKAGALTKDLYVEVIYQPVSSVDTNEVVWRNFEYSPHVLVVERPGGTVNIMKSYNFEDIKGSIGDMLSETEYCYRKGKRIAITLKIDFE